MEQTLVDAGMSGKIVHVTMQLLMHGSCRLVWNRESTDRFKPSRGMRQGDLLFPYLFVLCIDRLGHWLRLKSEEGVLRMVKASHGGPGLSYLFFVDDVILFSEAIEDQLQCLKEGLEVFCRASRQKVNYGKSAMLCSANIHPTEATRLSELFGVPLT